MNTDNQSTKIVLDHKQICEILPHRYPFLFVDRVVAMEKGESITAIKNFTWNEEFFQGHFPNEPVVPGVVQIEALAQVCCLLIFVSFPEMKGRRPAFTGIDGAKFKRSVVPGDVLTLEAKLIQSRRGFSTFSTIAKVDGQVVTKATIKATMV